MEKDKRLVDWSRLESQGLKGSKRKNAKIKRAQQELKKCLESEKLKESAIKSYSCAWQKDILVQGHLHLTENWICFYSNFFGWETKTNISLKDVTSISKQRTALVFPNAILVEVGDKKYGFASFVHRDRTYNVMQLIWQNSQLQKPSTGEALRNQLSHLTLQQKYSPTGRRSKSSSMTGDSSDVDPSSPAHSPSHAHASNASTVSVAQVTTASESDWGDTKNQVDGELYSTEHLLELPSSMCSSVCSSDAGSVDSSGSCHTPLEDPDLVSLETPQSTPISYRNKWTLNRSPSLITLKESEESRIQSEAILGGSPNFLHHWKQTLSVTTVWQTVVTLAKPQHLAHVCSPSRIISILIILFIVLLLLSTVSMLCQLSKVEPALQPYLGWQPWCSLC